MWWKSNHNLLNLPAKRKIYTSIIFLYGKKFRETKLFTSRTGTFPKLISVIEKSLFRIFFSSRGGSEQFVFKYHYYFPEILDSILFFTHFAATELSADDPCDEVLDCAKSASDPCGEGEDCANDLFDEEGLECANDTWELDVVFSDDTFDEVLDSAESADDPCDEGVDCASNKVLDCFNVDVRCVHDPCDDFLQRKLKKQIIFKIRSLLP